MCDSGPRSARGPRVRTELAPWSSASHSNATTEPFSHLAIVTAGAREFATPHKNQSKGPCLGYQAAERAWRKKIRGEVRTVNDATPSWPA